MDTIDADGLMKVEFMGAIHRRSAHRQDLTLSTPCGLASFVTYRPELRAGEVLLEFIERPPVIVKSGA